MIKFLVLAIFIKGLTDYDTDYCIAAKPGGLLSEAVKEVQEQ